MTVMIGTVTFDGLSPGPAVEGRLGRRRRRARRPRDRRADARRRSPRRSACCSASGSSPASTGSGSRARARSAAGSQFSQARVRLHPLAGADRRRLRRRALPDVPRLRGPGDHLPRLATRSGRAGTCSAPSTAGIDYTVFPQEDTWYVQVAVVVIGHVAALTLAHDRALTLYGDAQPRRALAVLDAGRDGRLHLARALAAGPGRVLDAVSGQRSGKRGGKPPPRMLARATFLLPRSSMKRTPWAALAAALIALACGAPAASADSIAYVKDGNVWLSTADGARQYQVTTHRRLQRRLPGRRRHDDRAQRRPAAQARPRDGAGARRLRHARLRHAPGAGRRRSTAPSTPPSPRTARRSPTRYYYMTQSQNPSCFPPTCVVAINEGGTGYSYVRPPDRLGRAGPRLPLRLAPPVVGRQRHDDDLQPDAPAEPRHHPRPHLRRRQRPRQHGHELDVSDTADGTRTSAAATSRATSASSPTSPARTTDADRLLRPAPSRPRWKDGDPNTGRDPTSATATASPAGGAFGVPTFSPGRRRDRLPRRRRHPRRGRPGLRRRLHAGRRHADPAGA